MEIRPVLTQEVDLLAALAAKLWPHHSKEELSEEFCEFLSCGIIFAAFDDSQMVHRFMEYARRYNGAFMDDRR